MAPSQRGAVGRVGEEAEGQRGGGERGAPGRPPLRLVARLPLVSHHTASSRTAASPIQASEPPPLSRSSLLRPSLPPPLCRRRPSAAKPLAVSPPSASALPWLPIPSTTLPLSLQPSPSSPSAPHTPVVLPSPCRLSLVPPLLGALPPCAWAFTPHPRLPLPTSHPLLSPFPSPRLIPSPCTKIRAPVFSPSSPCRDKYTCAAAAEGGHLGILDYLRSRGCPWSPYTMSRAASRGRLHILRWAHERGCPSNQSATLAAAAGGHLCCLKFLRSIGCPWNKSSPRPHHLLISACPSLASLCNSSAPSLLPICPPPPSPPDPASLPISSTSLFLSPPSRLFPLYSSLL